MAPDVSFPARILIVDDHPVVRLGMRRLIESHPGLSVVIEADTAEQAILAGTSTNLDLAIVDLSLKTGSGLELIQTLRAAAPKLPVLVLSIHDEALFAERCVRAGARGYIMKQEAVDNLITAIEHVLAGGIFVSQRVLQARLGVPDRSPPSASRLGNLTNREIAVFELLGRGVNAAAIASQLDVSVKTVEAHRSNIKTKLNLKTAADVVRHAAAWTSRF
jgi:DNA-binding NarL/FixJ family response regulator